MQNNLYIVIIAGGSGTRFWPHSRKTQPKQFITIIGNKSMFCQTLERVLPLKPAGIIVVTNELQVKTAEDQLESMGIKATHDQKNIGPDAVLLIAEPVGRNTAPAIALATALISRRDPHGISLVLPSDHYVPDAENFRKDIHAAAKVAANGYLVTLGIVPQRPETGYGYIQKGDKITGSAFAVKSFKEKPDLETAVTYLESGDFLWNAGMFVWRGDIIWDEIKSFIPDLSMAMENLKNPNHQISLSDELPDIYNAIASQSIDFGVMEKSKRVAVLPAGFSWSDIGSWDSLWELVDKDDDGNVCHTNLVSLHSRDNLVKCDKDVVALLGVENLILVETPDSILVCHREKAQQVKDILEYLKEKGLDHLL